MRNMNWVYIDSEKLQEAIKKFMLKLVWVQAIFQKPAPKENYLKQV